MHDAGAASIERSKLTQAAIAAALNSAAERIERVTLSLNQGLGGEIAVG